VDSVLVRFHGDSRMDSAHTHTHGNWPVDSVWVGFYGA